MEKEKEGINFTVNCSKMYLWNYLLCLVIFLVQRLTYCFFARYEYTNWVFKKTTVGWVLLMIFI